jgi:hypothetical protein
VNAESVLDFQYPRIGEPNYSDASPTWRYR